MRYVHDKPDRSAAFQKVLDALENGVDGPALAAFGMTIELRTMIRRRLDAGVGDGVRYALAGLLDDVESSFATLSADDLLARASAARAAFAQGGWAAVDAARQIEREKSA